jgi:toxin-antitoxin system PIN domain toxin
MTVLVDANVLLYAKFADFPQHESAAGWLDGVLNAPQPVGLPWVSLSAFLRIATNHRVFADPLSIELAVDQVNGWCERSVVWHPEPGDRFAALFLELLTAHNCSANLVTDAYLAALALEHGLTVVTTDADFSRFVSLTSFNPIA